MELSDRIRRALSAHNMTQEQFARRAHIRESHLSTIIRYGLDVKMSTYAKIDAALKELEAPL